MPTLEAARRWYPENDPVHGFDHVLRVLALAERLAMAEGAELEIVRAAALLHDAYPRDSVEAGERLGHQHSSAEFAAQVLQAEGWAPERIEAVQHCIRAHRFRDLSEPPRSLEAKILFDADKLDAIGAVGVVRAIGYALRAGQPAYARPSPRFLETGQLEAGEAHSAYHEYLFKLSKLKDRLHTVAARQLAEPRCQLMEAFFRQLAGEMSAAQE
ncbi:MAG: HD domain-containing protein [Anaerolineales bacterium]|nr:HD domain-containing protein [Anaerolineales bacterium]